jgi:hypothetical protein
MLCYKPYNLLAIVHFPTRVQNQSSTTIDSIFVPGIRTSYDHKKYIFLLSRDSYDTHLIRHYKQYCKILANVIKEAYIIIRFLTLLIKSKQPRIL